MKNQFFYTRKQPVEPTGDSKEVTFKIFRDSFNVEKIVRTFSLEDGRLIVLLDDVHERIQEVPTTNSRGVITGSRNQRNTVQTEIYLEVEDVERFFQLTNID